MLARLSSLPGATLAVILLAGCLGAPAPFPDRLPPVPDAVVQAPVAPRLDPDTAARNFVSVISRMEPQIEAECLRRSPDTSCDFRIIVDDRAGMPPNAFQTLDRAGQPIIAFTLALIADARNTDELAFILGHEAAHHIRGHIARAEQSAQVGAILGGVIASRTGADPQAIQSAQQIGAMFGARQFSQEFELEADELGTIIAWNAGYDPLAGVMFFQRIPDPGNRFLGTHPPNSQRIEVVRRTVARLGAGGGL